MIALISVALIGTDAGYSVTAGAQGLTRQQRGDDLSIRPFAIKVPEAVLKDLHERLVDTRWPDQLRGADWTYGTNLDFMKTLVAYWRDTYDWRAQERLLNQLPQFKTRIDGLDVHFVHKRSPEPGAFPIILLHGWPGTFFEFHKVVDRLTNPRKHGGNPSDAFDVVVVSLPGYGFSDRPTSQGHSRDRTARMFIELMTRLGYKRYGVQAGDVGFAVGSLMALADPDRIAGLQFTQCYAPAIDPKNPLAGMTPEEITFRDARPKALPPPAGDRSGYMRIQGTKPQTLGYGLNDSPVGQASWILEKYRDWCDCDGDPLRIFTRDELLTTVMIYWVTQTATSSARYYYEGQHMPEPPYGPMPGYVKVPTGCAAYPGDGLTPRAWAEKIFNVTRYTMLPKGGHFAALEQPELFTNEVRAFFREIR